MDGLRGLIDRIRRLEPLDVPDDMRELARKAAEKQYAPIADVEGWAERIAERWVERGEDGLP